MSVLTVLLAVLAGSIGPDSGLAADPFLRPYVSEIKKETPPTTLDRITAMRADDLILLHHGYGTWIRNKWLRSNRGPVLVDFFLRRGVAHPDEMSMVLIRALWNDLNQGLAPDKRARIETKRALVAAKRSTYLRLSDECAAQLALSRDAFERCFKANGLPSKNPLNRNPFFQLIVAKSGTVRDMIFFDGDSDALKQCLRPILAKYRFSRFEHDERLTLYLTQFPHCRVSEIDNLY